MGVSGREGGGRLYDCAASWVWGGLLNVRGSWVRGGGWLHICGTTYCEG